MHPVHVFPLRPFGTVSSDSVESGLSVPLLAFKDGFRDLDDLADELDGRWVRSEYRSSVGISADPRGLSSLRETFRRGPVGSLGIVRTVLFLGPFRLDLMLDA